MGEREAADMGGWWNTVRATLAAILVLAALLPTASWLPWLGVPLLAAAPVALMARSLPVALGATALAWGAAWLLAPTEAPNLGLAQRIDHDVAAAAWRHWSSTWTPSDLTTALLAGLAVTALLRRLSRQLVIGLALAVWGVQLVGALFLFAPDLFARTMRSPAPGTYAHDGALYRRTLDLMKTGLDYYAASRLAIDQDQRHADPQAPPHRVLRTPVFYWLLSLIPSPPELYVLAYGLALSAAGLAAFRLAWRLGGEPGPALVAPFALTPLSVYGVLADNFLFVDFWASALGLVAVALYVEGWRKTGLGLLWLCFLGREWMGVWLAAFLLDYFRLGWPSRRTLGALSAAALLWAGFMALHKHWSAGIIGPSVLHSYAEFLTFPGLGPVWASLRYGDLLALGGWLFAGTVGLLGLAGLWSVQPGGRLGLLGSVALPLLLFSVAGHAGTPTPRGDIFPPDYWGLLVWPGLVVGCALALAAPPRWPSLAGVLWAGFFLLILTRGALFAQLLQTEPRGMQAKDFRGNYYNGAYALQADFLAIYSPEEFARWLSDHGLEHSFDAWYPPLTYVAHVPFLATDDLTASTLYRYWNLAVIALIVTVNWFFAAGPRYWWALPPALVAGYLCSPAVDALFAGQVSLLLVLTTSLFCWLYLRGRPALACFFLALGISLKLTPAVFVGWLLWRRDWRACTWTAAGLLFWMLPVILYTRSLLLFPAFLARLPKVVEAWNVYVSQSVSSFVLKWFLPTDYWTPVVALPGPVAHALVWVVNLSILGLTFWCFRPRDRDPHRLALEMAALLVAHLIILSRSWPHQHTYLMLVLPLMLYAGRARGVGLVAALALVDGEAGQSVGEFVARATLLKWHLPFLLLLALWSVLIADLRRDEAAESEGAPHD